MARGSLETVAEAARRAQLELADAQYADIDGRWRALTIEVETTRMAANDLEKYHKARACAARDAHSAGSSAACKRLLLDGRRCDVAGGLASCASGACLLPPALVHCAKDPS